MKKYFLLAELSIIGLLIGISACTHTPEDMASPTTNQINPPFDTISCDSSNVSYPGTVQPILDVYCISCHSGPVPAGGSNLTVYSDVAFLAQSGLLLGAIKHLEGFQPMPQGGDKLAACEIALIEKWINDTTFVLPPDTTDCDTNLVTYAGTVYPIFQANCLSCHAPPAPEAGIDLTNYSNVAFLAQTGALLGAISHNEGFSPMPKNAPPLTSCEIQQIEKWINDTTFIPGGGGGIPCDPDTVYFQNEILPLLLSSCGIAGCHDPITAEEDIVLTSYYYVMQSGVVVPGQPWESEMYEAITDFDPEKRMPPEPAAPLNSDQINKIYTWIAQGALNNHCEQLDCDSVNVSFSETIFPIIQNSCYGCHSGPSPNGGISLETFNDVVAVGSVPSGSPGSLLGAITATAGNTPMPYNAPTLSDCNIAQIRKWIEDGMPAN
ncbi:MAG: hypothetical protein K9G76_05565 [Bacteroidales bacterium]|nr:hypothetical protein [Bacteroidales bacterium]MCF8403148.1 hypothetical protein [Bacteroidales bacterium]